MRALMEDRVMSRRLYGPSAEELEEPEEWGKLTPTLPLTNPLLVTKELTKTQTQQTTEAISQESIEVARTPLPVVPAKPVQGLDDENMGGTAITATEHLASGSTVIPETQL
jgi:hypothetical protein